MTVAALPTRATYVETGDPATLYAIPFQYLAASQIVVSRWVAGVESAVSAYAVTGDGKAAAPTGKVQLAAGVAGATLEIRRVTPRTQPTIYTDRDDFPNASHEDSADRNAMSQQEQDAALALTLRVPRGEAQSELVPAAERTGGGLVLGPDPTTGEIVLLDVGEEWKGDPGGNILAIGAFSILPTLDIPAGVDRIATTKAYPGGGGAADYVLDASQDAITARGADLAAMGVANDLTAPAAEAAIAAFELRFRRADAAGKVFTLAGSSQRAEPFRLSTDSDAQWLQAWCDYLSLWRGDGEVGLGTFTLDNSLFVTRGFKDGADAVWTRSRLRGSGRGFAGQLHHAGTELVFTALDRPGLIVQGGRAVQIQDVGIQGPDRAFIFGNLLGMQTSLLDETLSASWDMVPGGDLQHAVRAGVAVDALSGAAPADPYPALGDPAWIGTQAQYGRPETSVVDMDGVYITGWVVGIVVHPGQGNSQGDYVTIENAGIEGCKYGISIGNTQSRQVELRKVRMARLYCAFTNRAHGEKTGQFCAVMSNCDIGACVKLFDFSLASSGEMGFQSIRMEGSLYMGDLYNGGSGDATLRIESTPFGFWTPNLATRLGVWPYVVGEPTAPWHGNGTSNLSIADSTITVRDLCPLMVVRLRIEGLNLVAVSAQSAAPSVARAMAHNGTLGLVTPHGGRSHEHVVAASHYNLDSGAAPTGLGAVRTNLGHRATSRQTCFPYWLHRAIPKAHLSDRHAILVPSRVGTVIKSNFTGYAVSGRTLSFTGYSGVNEPFARYNSMQPGRVFSDSASGIWYYVESWDYVTGAVIAKALTGYRDTTGVNDGANDALYIPFDGATGVFEFLETGFYTPSEILLGDVTSGSAVVTNLRRPDGNQAWLAGEIGVGDYLWIDPHNPSPLFALYNNRVAALDLAGAHTMTMAGNATASVTGHRFELFMRKG